MHILLFRFIRIDGKTPPSDRSRLVNLFQDDDSVRVAILSIRAAGVGLTLTAASTVVFGEMTWTPGEIIQAEGTGFPCLLFSSFLVECVCAHLHMHDSA